MGKNSRATLERGKAWLCRRRDSRGLNENGRRDPSAIDGVLRLALVHWEISHWNLRTTASAAITFLILENLIESEWLMATSHATCSFMVRQSETRNLYSVVAYDVIHSRERYTVDKRSSSISSASFLHMIQSRDTLL